VAETILEAQCHSGWVYEDFFVKIVHRRMLSRLKLGIEMEGLTTKICMINTEAKYGATIVPHSPPKMKRGILLCL